ncbi:protein-glutamate O-methyltransferase CheR [Roseobacter sp.]|uniref:CheR family methyltransferase n=1 Tax=Roseobacter sp. TaxID=1907202 RepID=UPI003297D5FC
MTSNIKDKHIDPASFKAIAQLAYRECGLQLAAEKMSMIQSRLRHRLRALDIADFEKYSSFVCSEQGRDERRHMISALTTNVSHFFRENHHFEVLRSTLTNDLIPKLKLGQSVRIWSAGCSNGQEALSIAMTALDCNPEILDLDFRILATDIDPKVIEFAQNSTYPERLTTGIPESFLKRFFSSQEKGGEIHFQAIEKVRKLVSFRELNLISSWPMKQKMDVIFCRNVVIYFDSETQSHLWPRFHQALKPKGYLFLGHSERIVEPQNVGFSTEGPTAYMRTDATTSAMSKEH